MEVTGHLHALPLYVLGNRCRPALSSRYEGLLISPQPDQEGNKLQRPNSEFIQHTPHEAQYTSQHVVLTFASHSKEKNSDGFPSNQVSAAAMTSASEEKGRPFSGFFQSREQVVVRRGQIRRIGRMIKTLAVQVGQFLLGCKCPVSRGIVVQEQDPLCKLPAPRRFSFKMSFNVILKSIFRDRLNFQLFSQ